MWKLGGLSLHWDSIQMLVGRHENKCENHFAESQLHQYVWL